MLKEYPQEFVDSIMKLSETNSPSDTVYQGQSLSHILIIRVSPKNSDALETVSMSGTIFKIKHTCHGIPIVTRLVRDDQQTKQCVQYPM
jgi:hypothetical protein